MWEQDKVRQGEQPASTQGIIEVRVIVHRLFRPSPPERSCCTRGDEIAAIALDAAGRGMRKIAAAKGAIPDSTRHRRPGESHCRSVRLIDKANPRGMRPRDASRGPLDFIGPGRGMSRSRRTPNNARSQARRVSEALKAAYPQAVCGLVHSDPYQLLVATILSAQCTDSRVNQVTPELFRRYPDSSSLAGADSAELEGLIRSTGFFRAKARNLLAMAKQVVERHGGRIPRDLEALTALNGVGRKTANVVLGTAFGIAEGVVVDTHVKRLVHRSRHELGQDSRADRARSDGGDPSCGLGGSEPPADPARAESLPGAPTPVRDLPFAAICPKVGVSTPAKDPRTRPASRRPGDAKGTGSQSA